MIVFTTGTPKKAMTNPNIKHLLEFENECRLLPNNDHLSSDHKPLLNLIYPVAIYYGYSQIDKCNMWILNNHLSTMARNWQKRYHKKTANFRLKVISHIPENSKCTSSTVHLSQKRDFSHD